MFSIISKDAIAMYKKAFSNTQIDLECDDERINNIYEGEFGSLNDYLTEKSRYYINKIESLLTDDLIKFTHSEDWIFDDLMCELDGRVIRLGRYVFNFYKDIMNHDYDDISDEFNKVDFCDTELLSD